eukprot:UN11663
MHFCGSSNNGECHVNKWNQSLPSSVSRLCSYLVVND